MRSLIAALLSLGSPLALAGDGKLSLLSMKLDAPVERRIQLDPIGLRDLGVADGALDVGSNAGVARRAGPGLRVAPSQVPVTAIELHVRRQVPVRWRVDVPVDRRFDPPRVRIVCEDMDGRPGTLTHFSDGERMVVRVEAGAARVVARDDSREMLEGDVWLELDLSTVKRAGTYHGRIVVDMEYL